MPEHVEGPYDEGIAVESLMQLLLTLLPCICRSHQCTADNSCAVMLPTLPCMPRHNTKQGFRSKPWFSSAPQSAEPLVLTRLACEGAQGSHTPPKQLRQPDKCKGEASGSSAGEPHQPVLIGL